MAGTTGDAPFSQVVFHPVYADFYLGRDSVPFKEQPFHVKNRSVFADYEEMEDRLPVHVYEKPFCLEYLSHCRMKLKATIEAETEASLAGSSGIDFRKISRAELHVYNMRHIQHHAAQLGLRIQLATGEDAVVQRGKAGSPIKPTGPPDHLPDGCFLSTVFLRYVICPRSRGSRYQ